MEKEERLRQVVQFVNQRGGDVSVKDIAEALGISTSYARDLATTATERGMIDGVKSHPVIGYIFDREGRARTDGGERSDRELRVLTTKEALLAAVRDYAPHLLPEARGKTLDDLRTFVRENVADGTVVVTRAWRFDPAD